MTSKRSADTPSRPTARPPRTYDPERTREQLISAAVELFGRQGFHATSLQQVVDAAGLTKGAFYHHFGSKEDLLHLIHDSFIDAHLAVAREIAGGPGTAAVRLRRLVRALVIVVARHRSSVAVFFQERHALSGEQERMVLGKRDAAQDLYVELVAEGMRDGSLRSDLDARVAAFGVIGMASWVYQWYRPEGRFTVEELADGYADMAVRSLTSADDPPIAHTDR